MKRHLKIAALAMLLIVGCLALTGCDGLEYVPTGSEKDVSAQKAVANTLANHQATPTDIDYSLERYNLIRRTYWVNGQREKANTLICEIEKPLGYIVLFEGNLTIGRFIVDGKVSSLNSYLTPDSEYFEIATGSSSTYHNKWLADVDGTYGENDSGIFFFTPDGKYVEWTGDYLYSDIPFEVESPAVKYEVVNNE